MIKYLDASIVGSLKKVLNKNKKITKKNISLLSIFEHYRTYCLSTLDLSIFRSFLEKRKRFCDECDASHQEQYQTHYFLTKFILK